MIFVLMKSKRLEIDITDYFIAKPGSSCKRMLSPVTTVKKKIVSACVFKLSHNPERLILHSKNRKMKGVLKW